MTKPRPLPAPTGHAISLTRAAFFHARVGDTHALCCVLDRGVSADARNERGQTLLHIACSNRRFDAARLLLERGADPELPSQLGFTPLTTAAVDADDRLTALGWRERPSPHIEPRPVRLWWPSQRVILFHATRPEY